jgi:hypothetical protein
MNIPAEDLFNDNIDMPDIDGLELIEINLEDINTSAKQDAIDLIQNLSRFYYDEDFMKRNPQFKKRVDNDLESLRILFKMRKTDEEAHDILIKAIQGNSSNASLYKSLSEMQKTIISITSKIDDIVNGLNALMKGYQLELNFDNQEDNKDEKSEPTKNTHRGSKEFIEMMNKTWEAEEQEAEILYKEEA